MDKSPDAFRTISEVAEVLDTPAHVLRFWESRFPQIKPVKRAGGRRYYRPSDVALLAGIKRLLHDEGLTIRGVQKILRDQGARHVAGLADESVEFDDLAGPAPDREAALHAAIYGDVDDDVPAASASDKSSPLALTEALVAFDDPDDDTSDEDDDQPDLPLFPPTAPQKSRAPVARTTDLNLAGVLRQAAPGSLAMARPELDLIAQRLARHRNRLADRVEGGQG